MLYNLSKNIIESLYCKEDTNLELYIYGLELLFSSVVGAILLLVLGMLVGALIESGELDIIDATIINWYLNS